MKTKEWEDKFPRGYADEEFLNEMPEVVAAYFEMDGQIRAKYDHADASEYVLYLKLRVRLGL